MVEVNRCSGNLVDSSNILTFGTRYMIWLKRNRKKGKTCCRPFWRLSTLGTLGTHSILCIQRLKNFEWRPWKGIKGPEMVQRLVCLGGKFYMSIPSFPYLWYHFHTVCLIATITPSRHSPANPVLYTACLPCSECHFLVCPLISMGGPYRGWWERHITLLFKM